jgi:hypothetical protein
MIFERKIMRKILGPTRLDNGYWRIKTNQEINDTLKGQFFYFIFLMAGTLTVSH